MPPTSSSTRTSDTSPSRPADDEETGNEETGRCAPAKPEERNGDVNSFWFTISSSASVAPPGLERQQNSGTCFPRVAIADSLHPWLHSAAPSGAERIAVRPSRSSRMICHAPVGQWRSLRIRSGGRDELRPGMMPLARGSAPKWVEPCHALIDPGDPLRKTRCVPFSSLFRY